MGALLIVMGLAGAVPQAGRWETEVRMEVGEVPGAPPRTIAALRRLAGRPRTAWVCRAPDAPPDLVLSGDTACEVATVTDNAGRLSYRRLCPGVTANLSGSGTGSAFAVGGPVEGQPGLTLRVRGRRLAPTC